MSAPRPIIGRTGRVSRHSERHQRIVTGVHVDYTAKSDPQRVRDLLGRDAQKLLRSRVQVINLWRPSGPLRDAPFAVCDASTVAATDFAIGSRLLRPGR